NQENPYSMSYTGNGSYSCSFHKISFRGGFSVRMLRSSVAWSRQVHLDADSGFRARCGARGTEKHPEGRHVYEELRRAGEVHGPEKCPDETRKAAAPGVNGPRFIFDQEKRGGGVGVDRGYAFR